MTPTLTSTWLASEAGVLVWLWRLCGPWQSRNSNSITSGRAACLTSSKLWNYTLNDRCMQYMCWAHSCSHVAACILPRFVAICSTSTRDQLLFVHNGGDPCCKQRLTSHPSNTQLSHYRQLRISLTNADFPHQTMYQYHDLRTPRGSYPQNGRGLFSDILIFRNSAAIAGWSGWCQKAPYKSSGHTGTRSRRHVKRCYFHSIDLMF